MEVLLKEAVKKALAHQNNIKRQGSDLTVKIDKIGNRPSGELSDSLPLIQRTLAAKTYFGAEPLTRLFW